MENIDITQFKDAIFQVTESYRKLIIRYQASPHGELTGRSEEFVSGTTALDLKSVTQTVSLLALADDNISPEVKLHTLQAVKNTLDAISIMDQKINPYLVVIGKNEAYNSITQTLVPDHEKTSTFITSIFKNCLGHVISCHNDIDQVISKISSPPINARDLGLKIAEKRTPQSAPSSSNSFTKN